MKIGIDIGGSHVGIGIVNNSGEILAKEEKDYNKKEEDMSNMVLLTIIEVIEKIIKEKNLRIKDIDSIGIAMPGTVSNGIVIKAENLGIKNFNITEQIKKYFDIPVKLANDAKCAAIAEKKYGSLKNYDDALFFTIGTGVGGAAFLNGQLLKPKRYSGFEFGHMLIQKDGKQCNCGRRGCFEVYTSMKRLKEKIKEEFNLDTICGKQIKEFMLQNKGNKKLNQILDTYIDYLSIGIANLINIFEPQVISIGGSFTYYEEILLKKLENQLLTKGKFFNEGDIPKVVMAKLKNDAGIIGATLS
ncbi:MAG: ROK family protein [Clostridia bacterium]|nr:ROK family protein [Clostridia bacterium]